LTELSVVIATRNSGIRIGDTLSNLTAALAPLNIEYEVVVVDDASDDDTPQIAAHAHPSVSLLRLTSNTGMAGARQRGARLAAGAFLLFADDDVRTDPTSMHNLWQARSSDGCVCPLIYGVDGCLQNAFLSRYRWFDMKFEAQSAPVSEVAFPMGAALLVGRHALNRAGGWDDRYFPLYFEDTALGIALWRSGATVRLEQSARFVHLQHGGVRTLADGQRRSAMVETNRWVFANSLFLGHRRHGVRLFGLLRATKSAAHRRSLDPLRRWRHALLRSRIAPPQAMCLHPDSELLRRIPSVT
jgi:GT2 family glycosyltransferase